MGIFDFIRGELIEIIEWAADAPDTILWKFPDKDREIKMGAQLTVREGQVALMLNEGKLADVFTAGRHELTTRNMPLLTTLKSWKYGFESPFKVDIFFVNLREFTATKWGTSQPIMVSDPDFSLVPLRAFGSFNVRISDATSFFKNYAINNPLITTDELLGGFRSTVVTEFSNALKKSGKTLVEINARANELGAELLPILQPEFTRFGLTLTRFNVESVSLPPEIQQELVAQDMEMRKKRKSMGMDNEMQFQQMMNQANISQNIQDMNKFVQFQAAMGMNQPGGANGGSGSSETSDMMKTMMQMQMAQQMMQQMPNMNNASAPVAPANQSAPMSQEQVMTALTKLGELKTAGILSETEFETKKKELLARL